MLKKTFCCLLASLLILCAAAPVHAVDSALDALLQADQLSLTLGPMRFNVLNASSDEGLDTLNAFLAPLSASVSLNEAGGRMAFLADGQEIAATGVSDTGALTIPALDALNRVFGEILPALFDSCIVPGEEPEPEVRNASVKNLPRSVQRTTVTVTDAQLLLIRPAAVEALAALTAHLPHADALVRWAQEMNAAGTLTLKRLENAEGNAIAWQLTGRISSGGQDTRKLTLYGGIDGMNAYISLKLPARSGKNNLECLISFVRKAGKKQNTLTGSISYKRVMDKDSLTIKDTVNLTNTPAGDGQEWSGTLRRELTEDGVKTTWTLKPSLTADISSVSGTVTAAKKYAQTQVWEAEASIRLDTRPAEASETVDEAAFLQALTKYFQDTRAALSPERQRLLDHMLRTDAWMR